MRVAVIDGDATLAELPPLTQIEPGRALVEQLRDAGRSAADAWLTRRDRRRERPLAVLRSSVATAG